MCFCILILESKENLGKISKGVAEEEAQRERAAAKGKTKIPKGKDAAAEMQEEVESIGGKNPEALFPF